MGLRPWEARSLRINGQRIHVRIAGSSGPTVVLCHGFPGSWYSWRHQMYALADAGYRAVAIDMRGYGCSSKPIDKSAYRVLELVEDCVGVVQALNEPTAVIVGHDYGAIVAWTAAWTRPELFRGVVGMSVPFGGRGLAALPGSPFGELRPSQAYRAMAGPHKLHYREYFALPGDFAAREVEEDLRGWLTSWLYSLSADRPLPPEFAGVDLTALSDDRLLYFVRYAMCFPRGERFGGLLEQPDALPTWLDQDDLDIYVAELERGGVVAPLSYYTNCDLDWECLGRFEGKPLTVPALFIGGDRDVVTISTQEASRRAGEHVPDLRGSVIVPGCGHWIQQEQPVIVNKELVAFLDGLL